jgi:hypothetical protein
MTNELTRVLDAIKQDPHGEVARQASHWLAVNVMGWIHKIDIMGEKVYQYTIKFKSESIDDMPAWMPRLIGNPSPTRITRGCWCVRCLRIFVSLPILCR